VTVQPPAAAGSLPTGPASRAAVSPAALTRRGLSAPAPQRSCRNRGRHALSILFRVSHRLYPVIWNR